MIRICGRCGKPLFNGNGLIVHPAGGFARHYLDDKGRPCA